MIHDDGEYLRDPRPFDGHRVLVHRGIVQPATAAASATAGSGEGDGMGEAGTAIYAPCGECWRTPKGLTAYRFEEIDMGPSALGFRQTVPGRMTYAKLDCGHEPLAPDGWWHLTKELRELYQLRKQREAVLAVCDDGDKISPQYRDVTKRVRWAYGREWK